MKMNLGKTKVMFGGKRRVIEEFVARPKWPCATCGKGVGANSVKCTKSQLWVHGKCSGIQKSLSTVKDTFVCQKCSSGTQLSKNELVDKDDQGLDIGNGMILDKVSSFCYLGDVLDAGGGVDSAVTARVRCSWKKFRDFLLSVWLKKHH